VKKSEGQVATGLDGLGTAYEEDKMQDADPELAAINE